MNIKRQVPSSSFFDVSKGSLWLNTTASRNISEAIQENFYIYSSKHQTFKIKTLYLQGHFIFKKKKNGQNKIADIINATICEIEQPNYGAGIKITKYGQTIEIYGMIISWLSQLKFYCVQQDFANKYSIITLLGKGTFGKVYKIKSRTTHQNYAVKVFDKKSLISYSDYLVITKELQIVRTLSHSAITHFYETFENAEFIFIVYEMVEQGELSTLIKERYLSEEECLYVTKQLLQALLFMHAQGIMHRDLKPSNILLKDKNSLQIAITDFGLADFYRSDGKYIYTRCGTPGFVAPEVLQDKIYDYKIDIYSVGVILFMLLSGGKSPFQGPDADERLYQNYKECIRKTFNLLQSMLELDPSKRTSAKVALNHQVFRNCKATKLSLIMNKTPRGNEKILSPRLKINTNTNLDKYLQLSPRLLNIQQKPVNNMKKRRLEEALKMQTFSHRSPQLSPIKTQTKFEPFP